MDKDIELGDITNTPILSEATYKDEYLTPLANGNCSFATGEKSKEEGNTGLESCFVK